jgi:hypothetical protein
MDVRCTPGEATGTASRSRATERGSLTVRSHAENADRAGTPRQIHRSRAAWFCTRAQLVLLDEVTWWRTDDLWFWTLEALVTYVRAARSKRW